MQVAKKIVGAAAFLAASQLMATVYVVDNKTDASYRLDNALDGDTVLLQPGIYDNLTIEGRTGVTLSSFDPLNPAQIRPSGDATPALYIGHPNRVTVSNLVIDFSTTTNLGYGINADKQGQSTFGDQLSLRNITIRMTAPDGNIDGIHMSGIQNFTIENCNIQNWGTRGSGIDIVGAHHGMIRNNALQGQFIEDGSGIQMKGGARNITVRANRLVTAGNRAIVFGGGYTDPDAFEPGIKFEAKDLIAEGNVIHGGASPISFSSCVSSDFRYNLSADSAYWLGRILLEYDREDIPAGFPTKVGGMYRNNRAVWTVPPLNMDWPINSSNNLSDYEGFVFANNQWFNKTNPSESTPRFPVGLSETGGIYGVDPNVDPERIVPWQFSWGAWLVNGSLNSDTISLAGLYPEQLYLAIPGRGAQFNPSSGTPLSGYWSYQLVTSADLQLPGMSDAILINASMVPEPGITMTASSLILVMLGRRSRGERSRH